MIRTLSKSSPQAKEFLNFIKQDLKAHRVNLSFARTRKVRFSKGILTAGFFVEPSSRRQGQVRVGTGNRKPINILINLAHEYIHFLQWKHGDKIWTQSNGDLIEGSSYIAVEKQTERDAIRLLRDWNIPANYNAIRSRSRAYIAHLRRTES
jgi:hypothetical protein